MVENKDVYSRRIWLTNRPPRRKQRSDRGSLMGPSRIILLLTHILHAHNVWHGDGQLPQRLVV